ncbi:MAG: hypothetical protein LBK99_13890 [Opitutaceae bacterium]|nr:hypothetical protein [Opitutaceae bacterium]
MPATFLPEQPFLKKPGLVADVRSNIKADHNMYTTSNPKVFATVSSWAPPGIGINRVSGSAAGIPSA